MILDINYQKAIELLHKVSTPVGFIASAENTANYNRVWSRDGVICGLAALASNDENLVATFKQTLQTLAENQDKNGKIPSNVLIDENGKKVSYGGLAGRVDAVTWFIIGVCEYYVKTNDSVFFEYCQPKIEKSLQLLESWEFNDKHLIYTPLSGNWADEYITEGYVLYDQLLRVWALKTYNYFKKDLSISDKIQKIISQIEINFTVNNIEPKYHSRAYKQHNFEKFMPCSFSPAGYKTQFDALANSLAVLLNIGDIKFQNTIIDYSLNLANDMNFGLLPAFWPPIQKTDNDWQLLKENYNYNFKNFPNEFHNGGTWAMVNGFFGLALMQKKQTEPALMILDNINTINCFDHYSFFENFNTETEQPNGVQYCGWSAAAAILLHQSINQNYKFLIQTI